MTNQANQVIRPGEVTHCEKAAEDIFPPKPWLDPGEGWRLLEEGEIVRDGDEAVKRIGEWWKVMSPGRTRNQYLEAFHGVVAVRRRVGPESNPPAANSIQHGGDHYKSKPIQPWDYIASNGLGFFEGNIVKYVTRWPERGGLVDLKKAQHYIEKLIEIETAKETGQ